MGLIGILHISLLGLRVWDDKNTSDKCILELMTCCAPPERFDHLSLVRLKGITFFAPVFTVEKSPKSIAGIDQLPSSLLVYVVAEKNISVSPARRLQSSVSVGARAAPSRSNVTATTPSGNFAWLRDRNAYTPPVIADRSDASFGFITSHNES
jgi:hypothetical protein